MFNKDKYISGEAHFWRKLEGFNSDLVFLGLSTDKANTKQEGKRLFWQVLVAWGLQRDTFNQGGFWGGPNKYWVGFFGKSCWPFTLVLVGTWGGKGETVNRGGCSNRLLTLYIIAV